MLSLGGIIGALFAAFFTEWLKPRHTFFVCSLFGLFISYAASGISNSIDQSSEV